MTPYIITSYMIYTMSLGVYPTKSTIAGDYCASLTFIL